MKHPWQVIIEDRLPRKVFNLVDVLVSRTNFGLITVKTRKSCVFAFTSERHVRKVFSDLTTGSRGIVVEISIKTSYLLTLHSCVY